jgi:hypothetical protein
MATKSKGAKKSTKKAITVKRKPTNLKAAKSAPKKAVAKKTATKKKTAAKKVIAKKVIIKKKAASTRNAVKPLIKKAAPQKASTRKPAVAAQKIQEPIPVETNLPPVEEKSPEVIPVTNSSAPGMITKSMQREAVRHYDNHHIHLSNKKGGIKPSGKKPLW